MYGFNQSVTDPLFGYKQGGKEISLKTEAFHFNGIRTPGTHQYITFAVVTNHGKYTTCSPPFF